MVVKLTYTNALNESILLRSSIWSEQPLAAQQTIEVTFELHEDASGIARITLVCEPNA